MFARLGRMVVHHPWRVIAVWIVAAVGIVMFAPGLPKAADEAEFLPSSYESVKAIDVQDREFPSAFSPSVVAVFQRDDGGKLTGADSAKVRDIANRLGTEDLDNVEQVVAQDPSPNKLIQTVSIQMPEMTGSNWEEITDSVKGLRDALGPMVDGTDLSVGTTGAAAQSYDEQEASGDAEAIVGLVTILLILVLLLVIFRSPVIALLPIVLIGLASTVANGLIGAVARAFDLKVDSSITQLLIVVLFGVGTDYILFLMFRYRERLRAGDEPREAMVTAVARVGEAIASSAGVVIIAFMAMALSTLGIFTSMGPSLAIAVAVTLIAGLTLVPAVVSLLGTKVFWPSKAWKKEPEAARFAAIGRAVGRRPALFAGVSGAVLVALAIGTFSYNPTFDLAGSSVPDTAESQVALKDLQKGLPPGATDPSHVYVRNDEGATLDDATLADYQEQLAGVSGVGQVSEPTLSKDGTTADFAVTLENAPESDKALDTVKAPLRDTAHDNAPDGTTAYVGGTTAVYVDIENAMNRDYSLVFPVAAVLIMIVLGLMLRSLVAPWYLMLAVALGFAATLGATTIVFQGLVGESGLMFMLPLMMYMFVVALGTDYNILMVARLREEAKAGLSPRDAAAVAIKHAAPTIGAAGVILAGSLGSLALAGSTLLAEMGFALGFGILVVAFVMATFLTPALTALIGHAAWWPGHGDEPDEERLRRKDDQREAAEVGGR